MQDLRVVNESEGVDTTLGNLGLEFIDLKQPSISVQVQSRQVSGKHGSNKVGSQVGDTELELLVRFRAVDKLDYFNKEIQLKKLFSTTQTLTIAPMYSHGELYDFEKWGEYNSNVQQMYTLYYYDVLLSDDFVVSRNGLMGECTIKLVTATVPYRYTGIATIDLSKPTKREGLVYTYEFINKGTFTQDSKRFDIKLTASGIVGTSLELVTKDARYRVEEPLLSRDKLYFNGYSTKVNDRNVTNKTNYGDIKIYEGSNRLLLTVGGSGVLTNISGTLTFKEYMR